MEEQDPEEKKKKVLREISAYESAANRVVKWGQEIVYIAQYNKDLAQATKRVINEIPRDEYVTDKIWNEEAQGWLDDTSNLLSAIKALPDLERFSSITSGTTVRASGIMTNPIYTKPLPPEKTTPMNAAIEHYAKVIHSQGWAERAEKELKRFGLDSALNGKKNPIEQIRAAEAAFDVPSKSETDPTAVLIPLREAIETTLVGLINRLPKQERGKKRGWSKKILSIYKQTARPEFDETYFQRLSSDASKLNDDLSAAKQEKMSRHEIRILLDRGIAFLVELLSVLDHERLRKP